MPVVNPLSREVVFKVVYYGPGLGGKTTSLQHIHATTRAEHRGKNQIGNGRRIVSASRELALSDHLRDREREQDREAEAGQR